MGDGDGGKQRRGGGTAGLADPARETAEDASWVSSQTGDRDRAWPLDDPMRQVRAERAQASAQIDRSLKAWRAASGAPTGGGAAIPASGGAPLSRDVRARMEPKLGADLSSVRVHTSGESADAARDLGARAFTVGGDVHFSAGEFAPGSKEGDRLLAHELTHVVQGQRSGVQRKAEAAGDAGDSDAKHEQQVSDPAEPAEREADAVADDVTAQLHDKGAQAAGGEPKASQKPATISAKLSRVGRKIYRSGGGTPSSKAFTADELATLRKMSGGPQLLDFLDNDDPKKGKASGPDKKTSLIQEAKVAINEAKSYAAELISVGKEVPRKDATKGTLVEIDVETPDAIIQVKGGDYSKDEKLSGDDMKQLTNTKIYNEQMRIDPTTAKKLPPKKLIWQFTHPTAPVSKKLVAWLQSKIVDARLPPAGAK
jgi:hypothetical protein